MSGETGRAGMIRCMEHKNDLRNGKGRMFEHVQQYHQGVEPVFNYKIMRKFQGSPLERQVEEAIRIEDHVWMERTMNNKLEWTRPAGVRVVMERM